MSANTDGRGIFSFYGKEIRMRYLLIIIALPILLTACGGDPYKAEQIEAQAEATALAIQSEQHALNQELQRQHQGQLNSIDLAKEQLRYEQIVTLWQSTRPALMYVAQAYVYFLALGGAVAIILLGSHGVHETRRLMTGLTTATIQLADKHANLIRLDQHTGQFPALRYIGDNIVSITDINTGMTRLIDTRNEADPQLAAIAGAIRHTGVATLNTRLAKKDVADYVPAAAQPPIIIDAGPSRAEQSFEGYSDFFRAIFREEMGREQIDHDNS